MQAAAPQPTALAKPTTRTLSPSPSQDLQRLVKLKGQVADAFAAKGRTTIADQLRACTTTESLVMCTSCGKTWWVVTKCRLRVCPVCSKSLARDRATMIKTICRKIPKAKLLTLTMPTWTANPRDGIKFIRASFAKFRRSKIGRKIAGGAYQIELLPKPDGWHIHLHAIIDAPYIHYVTVWATWRDIIKVKAPQIDIRNGESDKAKHYICKYVSKAADTPEDLSRLVEWYDATHGSRLWSCFGTWYHAKPQDLGLTDPNLDTAPPCPFCGTAHSTIRARDGPFHFGRETWETLEKVVAPNGIYLRPRTGLSS